MAGKQETLIYIEQDNKTEAEFMSRSFVNETVKNRAYINALGAELAMKYLTSEGIDVSETHNIHSISKILEKIDISDILLPNIHIDVRVVFDENQIFIPKSHFSLEITPDIYIVLKLAKDFTHVEFLGYFEAKRINLKNKNSDYYFFEKEKLSSPDSLKQFVKNFPGNTSRNISQDNILRGRELSIAMADHNISDEEQKELLELLLLSDELRDSVLEFDNFETLSYSVGSELTGTGFLTQTDNSILEAEIIDNDESEKEDDQNSNSNAEENEETLQNEEIEFNDADDDMILDETFFDLDENISEPVQENEEPSEAIETEENIMEETEPSEKEETLFAVDSNEPIEENIEKTNEESLSETIIESEPTQHEEIETEELISTEENFEPLEDIDPNGEDLLLDDNIIMDEIDTTVAETTLTETEEVIEEPLVETEIKKEVENTKDDLNFDDDLSGFETQEPAEELDENNNIANEPLTENPLEKTIGDAVQKALEKSASTAATAGAIAAGAAAVNAAETVESGAAVTKDAIKLAGIAGDLVNDLINKNLESQQEKLDRIDYAKTTTNATEVPENITAFDLATAKIEADMEAEASGKFDTPKDLSELKPIETTDKIGYEEDFNPETIDLEEMSPIKTEEFKEHTESIVDLENLSSIDSPTTPVENLEEKLQENEEHIGMDLPSLSSFTINEDGTSPFDNIDINLNDDHEEHLVEFSMNSNEIPLDDNDLTTEDFNNKNDTEEVGLMLDDDFSDDFIEEDTLPNDNVQNDLTVEEVNLPEEQNIQPELNIEDSKEVIDETMEDNLIIDDSSILDNENIEADITFENTEDELSIGNEDSLNIEETSIDENIQEDFNPIDTVENDLKFEEQSELSDNIQDELNIDNSLSLENQDEIESLESNEFLFDSPIENEPVDGVASNFESDEKEEEEFSMTDSLTNVTDNLSGDEDTTIFEQNIDIEPKEETTSELGNFETPVIDNIENEPVSLDMIDNLEQNSTVDEIENNDIQLEVEAKDWIEDTNYDDLQDIEIPKQTEIHDEEVTTENILDEIPAEEFIAEPDENNEKVFTVIENSTVISDMNFRIGEIPIDINNNEEPLLEGHEQLESLYNPENTVPGAALLQNPGRLGSVNRTGNKAGLGVGLGIVGIIISLIIVGIIGFSVSKMLKQPSEENPQPITDDTIPTSPDNGVTDANTLKVDQSNVVNMDNTAPAVPTRVKTPVQTPAVTQQPAASAAVQNKKAIPVGSFLEVQKLTWEVPDYISYNQPFKQYFQAVGKSLKLSLTSDLLLATDYIYSDQVRVSILFAKDGTFKDAKILLSSGSTQVDNIVLQTVNQTLKVLKAPHSVGNDESTTVILKIYF